MSTDTGSGERTGRVVIISASAGAGHDGASRVLAQRLRGHGLAVDCLDLADLFPLGIGRLLQGTYRRMLNRAPWIYGLLFAMGGAFPGAGASTRALLRPVRSRTLGALPPDTRLVVSTYPVVSQVLGPLRTAGALPVPVATYLTDFAVNPIWVSPGVDLHCAGHPVTRRQACALGAAGVRVAGRLVDDGFRPGTPEDRGRARIRLGLPAGERLALLVAGSWGVGRVARAASDIARTGRATPVVVCGHNERLRRRLRRRGIRYVLGWVDDMADLMRAADVLVENAGGLTALEAMAIGLPVATYRSIPGHGRANAAAMHRAGVATWIRRRSALGPALLALADGGAGRRQRAAGLALFRTDPVAVLAELAGVPPIRRDPDRPAGTPARTAEPAPCGRVVRAGQPVPPPPVPPARMLPIGRHRRRTGAMAATVVAGLLAWRGYVRGTRPPVARAGRHPASRAVRPGR
ncbi:glycosyltransferase [Plantactinospora sp. GCM10030261]|uniref:glycosyltransferase n=1 Tax=Plantactinospora sp. GCM10030261 TaxID=3273420 RepID=UPI00361D97A2